MSLLPLIAVTVFSSLVFLTLLKKNHKVKNLPKGSLGLPYIGETLNFLRAQNRNQGMKWISERVTKYGPVFKTSLMGAPTVIIIGQEAGVPPRASTLDGESSPFCSHIASSGATVASSSITSVVVLKISLCLKRELHDPLPPDIGMEVGRTGGGSEEEAVWLS
ncbi:hypothetical protein IFM89_003487 [Coptis chinensis]|uniref:Cytochrome P450 n=1 Tax=Coptis chinensis TaxID=261450 RepID=A0A835H8R3_9MAGN|nr:hypothetical protein IFM89_003487 [Coptis chinensis]